MYKVESEHFPSFFPRKVLIFYGLCKCRKWAFSVIFSAESFHFLWIMYVYGRKWAFSIIFSMESLHFLCIVCTAESEHFLSFYLRKVYNFYGLYLNVYCGKWTSSITFNTEIFHFLLIMYKAESEHFPSFSLRKVFIFYGLCIWQKAFSVIFSAENFHFLWIMYIYGRKCKIQRFFTPILTYFKNKILF